MLAFIWAESNHHIIGSQGKLPWSLPNDMRFFKENTINNTIVTGSKTYDSFKRPLPNRINIVLSTHRSQSDFPSNVILMNQKSDILEYEKNHQGQKIFIIGGSRIFNQFIDDVDYLYKTVINYDFDGDTKMPEIDYNQFELINKIDGTIDEKNKYQHHFEIYKRKTI
ncbi:dihydrofolate reductase [Lactobacillus sp. S2-2]|uniref:dihydrofolate reductase n=1 Tax=Lactobacillus sp. S2-2 TaxID=2692917 RepID=UPI001F41CFDD|nr:dihydrofolate reductase [Lactobacillus sp. S2-2]MCF6515028.1 dihydrofolate reductase [Lactobacillus sp. S2-2]